MSRRLVDLSMDIHEGMQTFAAHWHPMVEITQLGRHGIENRETRKLVLGTHTGTHVDAPRHFIAGGGTIDGVPLEQLVGPASVVDLADAEPFQQVEVSDLERAVAGRPVERIIVRFDWDLHLGTSRYYSDHPYFSEDACQWLVDQGCRLVALDTPQPDNPENGRNGPKDAPNHHILLGNGVILVEYLVNIRKIRAAEVELVVAPLRLREGDGAPARVFVVDRA